MVPLPNSIESALREADFSGTEIIVLRRLLEEDSLTLRELAAKTGKSTGVLDQSMRKLLRKGILTKQEINGTSKYVIHSLNAIAKWMEQDMQEKRTQLSRRFENFESFLHTLQIDKKRPDMEYFDGEEGLMQAYEKLLTFGKKELLHYVPVICSAEDDPLRDFRVQFFRERRSKGIFSRMIAHNTPLGRRHQSRDPFEYRQTVLVDEKQYPFTFEKVIVNGTVACFNLVEKRACFIHFPEFAESERMSFDLLWAKETDRTKSSSSVAPRQATAPAQPSLSTRTFSALREFFLSKRSILSFAIFALVAAGITAGLYMRTSAMNLQRMKDKVESIATTASFQFDAKDLEKLQVEADWKKPEWAKVVNQLKDVRQSNSDILFIYIYRKNSRNPEKLEFVSDSHSLNPYANTDSDPNNNVFVNVDGKKMQADTNGLLQWPGQSYPDPSKNEMLAFEKPATSDGIYDTQWGKVVSGYAPIKENDNNTVAVIGVDMAASKLNEFNAQSFTPVLYFLGLFLLFVLIRLTAFNRSLLGELWTLIRSIRLHWSMGVVVLGIIGIACGVYYYIWTNAVNTMGLRMQAIAATAASSFSDLDLDSLRFAKDMKTETYQKAFKRLNDIRNRNPGVKYAYIYRSIKPSNLFEFVADADSNYFIPEYIETNFDGKLDAADQSVFPGFVSEDSTGSIGLKESYRTGLPAHDFGRNQWGSLISGYAPIFNKQGKILGVLGIDFDMNELSLW